MSDNLFEKARFNDDDWRVFYEGWREPEYVHVLDKRIADAATRKALEVIAEWLKTEFQFYPSAVLEEICRIIKDSLPHQEEER